MRDRMKNTGLLALLLALCLTLAACGSAPASSGPAASAGGAADSASSAAESQLEPEEAPAPAEPSSSAAAEGAFFSGHPQEQNRWLPMTLIRGRLQIQALVAVLGLK